MKNVPNLVEVMLIPRNHHPQTQLNFLDLEYFVKLWDGGGGGGVWGLFFKSLQQGLISSDFLDLETFLDFLNLENPLTFFLIFIIFSLRNVHNYVECIIYKHFAR